MKFSVSSRQPMSLLKKADEIIVRPQDIDRIFDFIEELPDKTIIYYTTGNLSEKEWGLLELYNNTLNFIVASYSLDTVNEFKTRGIKFYWAYPISSFYELQGVLALDPCYLLLGPPLCFQLDAVTSLTQVPIRLTANIAYDGYIPHTDGVCGHWIRPEDVVDYEPYVAALEFMEPDLKKEAALYKIYAEDRNWPGNLNLLIKNFGINVDNRGIPEDLAAARLNCGQRCMQGKCHLCENAIKFSLAATKRVESK